jgi:hypothetical protein
MTILDPQQLVDDVAVVGEQYQSLGVLVEPTDGKDPKPVVDEVEDIVGNAAVGTAVNADRLVEGEIYVFLFGSDCSAVETDAIGRADRRAECRRYSVDGDAPRCDPGIRDPPRAQAALAQEFVEPEGTLCDRIGGDGVTACGRPARRSVAAAPTQRSTPSP